MAGDKSIFKTLDDEKQYMELYDKVLTQWNIPVECKEIATRFGKTHINVAGSKNNPPMVLIPGFGANSAMWYPNAAALSIHFRIYAVDTNGQPGKSGPDEKLNTLNSSDWITQVLDGLQIE
jgi:pimeloyl-ACP methyl ester carboxylesterase